MASLRLIVDELDSEGHGERRADSEDTEKRRLARWWQTQQQLAPAAASWQTVYREDMYFLTLKRIKVCRL